MKRKAKFLIVSLVVALFIVGSLLEIQVDALAADVQAGKEAPDFTLPDINGKSFTLSKLKGKVIILDFWATWCPPCRAEIPHFKSLYEEYKEKGLEVIGVALDQGGAKAVIPFVDENKIIYPILIGDQKVTEDYGGIRGIPTTFIIDRKGNIVEKFVGYQDKEVFESAIKELL